MRALRRRRGNAAIEFALTLPLLLLLIGGIVEWGLFAGQQLDVLRSVREGVRAGAGTNEDPDDESTSPESVAQARAEAVLAESNLGGTYSATASVTDLGDYSALQVDATAEYVPLMSIIPVPATTDATFTMMLED